MDRIFIGGISVPKVNKNKAPKYSKSLIKRRKMSLSAVLTSFELVWSPQLWALVWQSLYQPL